MIFKRKLIIAIDGPAGSGKSSTARALAKRMKLPYIDTGAMYRALTLLAMRKKISFENKRALVAAARRSRIELKGSDPERQRVYLNGRNVTKAIRTPDLTRNVFYVAQEPLIRRELVKKQRAMAGKAGAVMEGRDIGTVVFPRAHYKFYFVASDSVRARRRHRELAAAGQRLSLAAVKADMIRRDKTDYSRSEGPLKPAPDAIRLDTSLLTIQATVDKMLAIIESNPFKRGQLRRIKPYRIRQSKG